MPTNVSRDLKNHAYQVLKERLINYIYEPDTMLNEAQLATSLGLSRTPVRGIINRLEMDGFVRTAPKKGIYMSDIQLSDILQIFQTRYEVEPVTLHMAVSHLPMEELCEFRKKFQGDLTDTQNRCRLDTVTYLFIIEHYGDHYIIDMTHKLLNDNTRVIVTGRRNQVQIHDARHGHLETIETLIDKECEKATTTMQIHIESCHRVAVDYLYSLQASSPTSPPTYKQRLQELGIQIISQDIKLRGKRLDDMYDKNLTTQLRQGLVLFTSYSA